MKIHIRKNPDNRHYIAPMFGKLVVPRKRQNLPGYYPAVTGGHVAKEVTRAQAAEGLKIWRKSELG